jgi:hypothetical protein
MSAAPEIASSALLRKPFGKEELVAKLGGLMTGDDDGSLGLD